jgi:hypothetical protein
LLNELKNVILRVMNLMYCIPLSPAVFGMGAANTTGMMGMQQQQQGVYGNMQQGMVGLQNQTQNPNFPQQRQQNQQ